MSTRSLKEHFESQKKSLGLCIIHSSGMSVPLQPIILNHVFLTLPSSLASGNPARIPGSTQDILMSHRTFWMHPHLLPGIGFGEISLPSTGISSYNLLFSCIHSQALCQRTNNSILTTHKRKTSEWRSSPQVASIKYRSLQHL